MRFHLVLLPVVALALLQACASTPNADGTATTTPRYVVDDRYNAEAPAGDDVLICTYERETGTQLKRRYCATKAARDRQSEANREAANSLLGSGRTSSTQQPTADVNF